MKYELADIMQSIRDIQYDRHGHQVQRQRSMFDPMHKYTKWKIEWEWYSVKHRDLWDNLYSALWDFQNRCQAYIDEGNVNVRMCDYMFGEIAFCAFTHDVCDRMGKDKIFASEYIRYLLDESEKLYFRARAETNGKWYADPSTAWQNFFDRTVPLLVKKANLKFEGTTI